MIGLLRRLRHVDPLSPQDRAWASHLVTMFDKTRDKHAPAVLDPEAVRDLHRVLAKLLEATRP